MSAKYIWLSNILRNLVLQNTGSGVYKLPSENTLCAQYHVSRQTVRAALQLLADEGLIEKRHGSGSFSTGLGSMKNTIAVIVNNSEEYTSPTLLADIKSALRAKGYATEVYSTLFRVSSERKILEELLTSSIRGLIVEGTKSSLPNPNLDLYGRLKEKGVAILFVNSNYPALTDAAYIRDDNFYGGYLLGKHLIQKGHRNIAAIFRSDDIRGPERYYGLAMAMKDFSLPVCDDLIAWYGSAELEALESRQDTDFLIAFLRKVRGSSTAIICQDDEIAYWLIRELRYADIHVPENISVVSFDNSYMSDLDTVRITSLSHKNHEMGAAAAETLLRIIQGEPAPSEELSWRLISKGSDAPCQP